VLTTAQTCSLQYMGLPDTYNPSVTASGSYDLMVWHDPGCRPLSFLPRL
jgi:hypothetical protein